MPRLIPTLPVLTLALAICSARATAQDHQQHDAHAPYAGLQERAIKALSAEDVEGLLAGDGMGFALSAELNGLPGPKHVLELASQLALSEAQAAAVGEIRDRMQEAAVELGQAIVDAETHLDRMFAMGHAAPDVVLERTTEIGTLRGQLRAVHLNAHLETVSVLSEDQVAEYVRLRGYGG